MRTGQEVLAAGFAIALVERPSGRQLVSATPDGIALLRAIGGVQAVYWPKGMRRPSDQEYEQFARPIEKAKSSRRRTAEYLKRATGSTRKLKGGGR